MNSFGAVANVHVHVHVHVHVASSRGSGQTCGLPGQWNAGESPGTAPSLACLQVCR